VCFCKLCCLVIHVVSLCVSLLPVFWRIKVFINVWNWLRNNVDFRTFSRFKRTVNRVDFATFLGIQ